ncbi:hypothetical protein N665_0129s0068 [Sinapis alba]|nr:hypothetical protein N665_0129s0068 [Sinapis alba]
MSPQSGDLTSKCGNVLVKETLCLPPTLTKRPFASGEAS